MASYKYRLGPVSAYAIAKQNDPSLTTEQKWLESLTAYGVAKKNDPSLDTEAKFLESLTAYGLAKKYQHFQGTVIEWLESLHATDSQVAEYLVTHPEILQQMNPMRGSVATMSALPTEGNAVNDTYYVQSENAPFTWTGSEWVRSGINETDYADILAEVKETVRAITDRSAQSIGLTWVKGNLNATTGAASGNASTNRIRCGMTDMGDYGISLDEGLQVFPYFYDENDAFLGQGSGWITSPTTLRAAAQAKEATAGAAKFRLVAAFKDASKTIAVEDGNGVHILSPTGSAIDQLRDDLAVVRFPDEVTAFEVGGIYVDTGADSSTTSRMRTTDYLPLGEVLVNWNASNYQYLVIYYDENKGVLTATDWSNASQVIRRIEVDGKQGHYVRFVFCSTAGNSYSFATSGPFLEDGVTLTLPEGCSIRGDQASALLAEMNEALDQQASSTAEADAALKEELIGKIDEFAGSIFAEEINDFIAGGITTGTNGGGETTHARRMKTRNYHKLGEVRITWNSSDFAYFIVYYDESMNYLQAVPESGWLKDSRTVRPSDVSGARYVRFVFCHMTTAGADNSYSFTNNGLTLPEGCSIKSTSAAATNIELDTSLMVAGMAADAAAVGEILSRLGWIPLPAFVQGARKVDGSISTSASVVNFNITMAEPVYVGIGKTLSVHLAEGWTGSLNYGPSPTGPWSKANAGITSGNYVTQNEYLFVNLSKNDENGAAVNVTPMMAAQEKALLLLHGAAANDELQYDMPENLGVINLRKRAHQLVALEYTVTNTLIRYNGSTAMKTYRAGDTVSGMVYSSARTEESFVPQTVSIHTFMTAVLNPKSYLYTRQDPMSNQKLYYGAVCSTFVDYCYGIDYSIPTTYMLEDMEGMTRNEDQSVYGLKLGDLLSRRNYHVAVITDILRNRRTGEIVEITISEASVSNSRSRKYTPEEYYARLATEPLIAFRWNKLAGIGYEPSPWVNVWNESETPEYSTRLSPRRGDKANWRAGETVEVDILDPGNYPNWKLYKNDVVFQTGTIGEADLLSFPGLGYGSYKLCLTGDGTDSEFVYWIVVECQESYTDLGNGKVRCAFSSPNATPLSLNWNYNLAYETNTGKKRTGIQNAIFKIEIMDNAARQAGQITSTFEPGTFDMRVAYRTEYGMYWSDVQEVTLV